MFYLMKITKANILRQTLRFSKDKAKKETRMKGIIVNKPTETF